MYTAGASPRPTRGASAEKTKKENKSETKTKKKSSQSNSAEKREKESQTAGASPRPTRGALVRKGRQTPTASVTLPYEKSEGKRAIEIYNSTGRTAQEWQELLIYDILAKNDDDLWTHTKFGYSVPRRNGKNEIVAIREMYGLAVLGEHILHTAHRTTTTHSAWERLLDLLGKAKIEVVSSYRALGKEQIE